MSTWAAPKYRRRFQSTWRSSNGVTHIGKVHVAMFYRFTLYGTFSDWIPACATPEQIRKWSLRMPPGRVMSAGTVAPITCSKCIARVRDSK